MLGISNFKPIRSEVSPFLLLPCLLWQCLEITFGDYLNNQGSRSGTKHQEHSERLNSPLTASSEIKNAKRAQPVLSALFPYLLPFSCPLAILYPGTYTQMFLGNFLGIFVIKRQ